MRGLATPARPDSILAKLDPTRPPLRWILRSPRVLYRANLGWLLGHRFLQLTVRGRRSGLPRAVVLEVIGRRSPTGELLVASGWGRQSEWYRNVRVNPRGHVRVGRRRFEAEIVELDEPAAEEALQAYARAHRWAYRWFIGPVLVGRRPRRTAEEFAQLARSLPILAIRETDTRSPSS